MKKGRAKTIKMIIFDNEDMNSKDLISDLFFINIKINKNNDIIKIAKERRTRFLTSFIWITSVSLKKFVSGDVLR